MRQHINKPRLLNMTMTLHTHGIKPSMTPDDPPVLGQFNCLPSLGHRPEISKNLGATSKYWVLNG